VPKISTRVLEGLRIFWSVMFGIVIYVFVHEAIADRLYQPIAGHIAVTNIVVITLSALISACAVSLVVVVGAAWIGRSRNRTKGAGENLARS
jgi:hypothetical protein